MMKIKKVYNAPAQVNGVIWIQDLQCVDEIILWGDEQLNPKGFFT